MFEAVKRIQRSERHDILLLKSLPPSLAQKLRAHWIDTVEQFVALCGTEQGREGLKTLLTETQVPIEVLLGEAREILGDGDYETLMLAKPGGPLGALFNDPKGGVS
mgnify:CR=1 FL=1